MITLGILFILLVIGRCFLHVNGRPIPESNFHLWGFLFFLGAGMVIAKPFLWIAANMP